MMTRFRLRMDEPAWRTLYSVAGNVFTFVTDGHWRGAPSAG